MQIGRAVDTGAERGRRRRRNAELEKLPKLLRQSRTFGPKVLLIRDQTFLIRDQTFPNGDKASLLVDQTLLLRNQQITVDGQT